MIEDIRLRNGCHWAHDQHASRFAETLAWAFCPQCGAHVGNSSARVIDARGFIIAVGKALDSPTSTA